MSNFSQGQGNQGTKIHRLILRIPLLIRFYGNFACTQVLHLNLYKPMVYNTSTILVVNLGELRGGVQVVRRTSNSAD